MAHAWLALADQADKNCQAPTLVCETLEPHQPVQQQRQPQSKKG